MLVLDRFRSRLQENEELSDVFHDLVYDGGTFEEDDFIVKYVDDGYDGSEECYVIFSVEYDGSVRFGKVDGYCYSYSGEDYGDITDFHEVEQVEKTIKVWERK